MALEWIYKALSPTIQLFSIAWRQNLHLQWLPPRKSKPQPNHDGHQGSTSPTGPVVSPVGAPLWQSCVTNSCRSGCSVRSKQTAKTRRVNRWINPRHSSNEQLYLLRHHQMVPNRSSDFSVPQCTNHTSAAYDKAYPMHAACGIPLMHADLHEVICCRLCGAACPKIASIDICRHLPGTHRNCLGQLHRKGACHNTMRDAVAQNQKYVTSRR